ncbi:MAG: hypothetical protein GY810_02055, partial [Aureispira sp.]|nr:hypothetical protein [Aureispira sp.]
MYLKFLSSLLGLMFLWGMVHAQESSQHAMLVDAAYVHARLDSSNVFVLDCQKKEDYFEKGHIPGAIQIRRRDLT